MRLILILSIFFAVTIFPQSEKLVDRVLQLTKALSDKNENVRVNAAKKLGKIGEIGPKAEKAIPALIKSLSHYHGFVRADAARALGKIDPNWKTQKYPKELQEIVDKYLKK